MLNKIIDENINIKKGEKIILLSNHKVSYGS